MTDADSVVLAEPRVSLRSECTECDTEVADFTVCRGLELVDARSLAVPLRTLEAEILKARRPVLGQKEPESVHTADAWDNTSSSEALRIPRSFGRPVGSRESVE